MNQTISHPLCHPALLSPADDYVEDHLDLNLLQHLTCCEECRLSKVGLKEAVELTCVNVRYSALCKALHKAEEKTVGLSANAACGIKVRQ